MALLMLKTQDLTYQDHVINVEVMLAPARSQLLSNKHKTLSSKCNAAKRMYEKERESVIKDFVIEKRMMERKKQAIFKRRSEILLDRVSSTSSASSSRSHSIPDVTTVLPTRGKSAPPNIMMKATEGSISSGRSDIFLTEVKNTLQRKDNSEFLDYKSSETSRRNSVMSDINFPVSSATFSTRESIVRSTTPPYYSGATTAFDRYNTPCDTKSYSKPTKSVRFEPSITSASKRDENIRKLEEPLIENKIKEFLKKQEDFNKKPLITSRKQSRPFSEPISLSPTKNIYHAPLVAKRYTNLTLDTKEIERAFDNFCVRKSKDDLQKLIKVASKLKASVRLARNQSILPTMAVYRSSKAFKNLLKKPKTETNESK